MKEKHFMWLRHGWGNVYHNMELSMVTPHFEFKRLNDNVFFTFHWFRFGFDIGYHTKSTEPKK
jgi:hypothetical protein